MIRYVPRWLGRAHGLLQRQALALLLGCFCLPAWSASGGAQPAGLVLKTSDQGLWVDGLKSIAIGTLALAIAAAGLFWLRGKYSVRGGAEQAKFTPLLKSSRRISQKTLLLVVQWENKIYLLAEHGQTTQLLDSRAVGDDGV